MLQSNTFHQIYSSAKENEVTELNALKSAECMMVLLSINIVEVDTCKHTTLVEVTLSSKDEHNTVEHIYSLQVHDSATKYVFKNVDVDLAKVESTMD